MILHTNLHYFDYAATTFMCNEAIQEYVYFQQNISIMWGKGNNILSSESKKFFDNSIEQIRLFFGISEEYEIIFGKNVTELINIITLSLEKYILPMDVILVGPYEHHSNFLPWKYLAKKRDAIFIEMPVDDAGNLDIEFLNSISDKVKVVAYSSISNTNGYIIDEEIIGSIFDKALIFVDESQKNGHEKITTLPCISGYILSSHKMYGPKNIAGAFIDRKLFDIMKPIFLGGGMIEYQQLLDTWQADHMKYLAGTYDIGLIAAWAKACKYINDITFDVIRTHERKCFQQVKEYLLTIPDVKIINNDNSANSLLSFVHRYMHAHDIERYLSQNNIIIRSGNMCAQPALRKIGYDAITRISFGINTTDNDIDLLKKYIHKYLVME